MNIKYWPEELRAHLRATYKYDPDAGTIERVVPPARGRQTAAGSVNANGKRTMSVFCMGRQWLLEQGRVALFLVTGKQHTAIAYVDGDYTNLTGENLIWAGKEITANYDSEESRAALVARAASARDSLEAKRVVDKKAKEYNPMLDPTLSAKEREYLKDQATDPSVYALTPEKIAALSAKQEAEESLLGEALTAGGWIDHLVEREDVYVEVERWVTTAFRAGLARQVILGKEYVGEFLLHLRMFSGNNVVSWEHWDELLCKQVVAVAEKNFSHKWEWDAAQVAIRLRWERQGHARFDSWLANYSYNNELPREDFRTTPSALLASIAMKFRKLVDGDTAWEELYKRFEGRVPAYENLAATIVSRLKAEILSRAAGSLQERPLAASLSIEYIANPID